MQLTDLNTESCAEVVQQAYKYTDTPVENWICLILGYSIEQYEYE